MRAAARDAVVGWQKGGLFGVVVADRHEMGKAITPAQPLGWRMERYQRVSSASARFAPRAPPPAAGKVEVSEVAGFDRS